MSSPLSDEREVLLRAKSILEERSGLAGSLSATSSNTAIAQNSNNDNTATSSITLSANDLNDVLQALNKALASAPLISSTGNNNNNNNGSNMNQNRSPFSLQGQSLTALSDEGGSGNSNNNSRQQVSLVPPPAVGDQQQQAPIEKSPEDPFARVQPFSSGAEDNNNNDDDNSYSPSSSKTSPRGGNGSGGAAGGGGKPRRRTQSVSFAPNENPFSLDGAGGKNPSPFAQLGNNQEFSGGSVEEFESRFSGLPIASRSGLGGGGNNGNNNNNTVSPFDENVNNNNNSNSPFDNSTTTYENPTMVGINNTNNNNNNNISNSGSGGNRPFSLDAEQISGGKTNSSGNNSNENQQQGVRIDDLQLDYNTSRRKSAVCTQAPHLSLASPRREADYILFPEEEAALIQDTLNAVAELFPQEFAKINQENVIPPFDVNDSTFDVMSFCNAELFASNGGSSSSPSSLLKNEKYTFILVATHIFSKYRFMSTFGSNPTRFAKFLVELLGYYYHFDNNSNNTNSTTTTTSSSSFSLPPLNFTGALRAAVNLHCIHLILSDPKLGSQLTDIELAACLFATLAARASNLGVSNEFLFRSNHPYARLFPGWSPQEQVSVTVISELFRDFENTNPFSKDWWSSDEELGDTGVDAARRGVVFTELVADLILTTDTRHQQWLLKECSDALKKAEGAVKGRARRGSIKFGENSIIRVADMHRILRCLVHLSEQYAYILSVSNFDSFKGWVTRWILETRAQGTLEMQTGVPVTFHCREATNSAEYHIQFMQMVVVPFVEMLHAVLPHAFTVTLFDNTQRLSQLHGEVFSKLEQQQQQQQQNQQQQQDQYHTSLNLILLSTLMNNNDIISTRKILEDGLNRYTVQQPITKSETAIPSKFNKLMMNVRLGILNNSSNNNNNISPATSNNKTSSSNNTSSADSATMQTAMRLIDNRMRVVELKYGKNNTNINNNSSSSSPLAGSASTSLLSSSSNSRRRSQELHSIEVEVVRLVRDVKNDILRPSLRNLSDEEVVEALVDNSQTSVGSVFDSTSDAFLALLLRVVRYAK